MQALSTRGHRRRGKVVSLSILALAAVVLGVQSPAGADILPQNWEPGATSLLSPADHDGFIQAAVRTFGVRADDPNGDPYLGVITVRDAAGAVVSSVQTAIAPSGTQASVALPTLNPGRYSWTAHAVDPYGAAGMESLPHDFTVLATPNPLSQTRVGTPTTLVGVDSAGNQPSEGSGPAAMSADGRYVLITSAAKLAASDTNAGYVDVYRRDRMLGTTIQVSLNSSGISGNRGSARASVSSDGRYVVFSSWADNLVAGDTNNRYDIFVRDILAGTTERVSVSSSGVQANDLSSYWFDRPVISADGRYVAFSSDATNLVSGDTNGLGDAFVRDRTTGTTSFASVNSAGTLAGGGDRSCYGIAISGDGRYVAFMSSASNLVAGDTNLGSGCDVFVRDRTAGTTTRANVAPGGVQARYDARNPAFSANGRFLAFTSGDLTLAGIPDTNRADDVFVRDLATGVTTLESVDSSGRQTDNRTSDCASVSAGGRYIAFYSSATNLVAGDVNASTDAFVRDRVAGTTTRVSVDSAGRQATGASYCPVISQDGLSVAFGSAAPDLVVGDTNATTGDAFVQDARRCFGAMAPPGGCIVSPRNAEMDTPGPDWNSAPTPVAPGSPAPSRPGQLLVAFQPGASHTAANSAAGGTVDRTIPELNIDVVSVQDMANSLSIYRSRSEVKYAGIDGSNQGASAPNDPLYFHQWHLQPLSVTNKGTANVEGAYPTANGSGVTVAVLDTGFRTGGHDMDPSRLVAGYNFINNSTNTTDDNSHGTMVADVLAESTNNSTGLAGVAPAAKIMPVKVLDASTRGSESATTQGIVWAADHGAKVINMSLGDTETAGGYCDAVTYAVNRGVVVVAAVGNQFGAAVEYPARCPGIIAVGAATFSGQVAGYSNVGPELSLVAPGGDSGDLNGDGEPDGVYAETFDPTTGLFDYYSNNGTSLASPHVAGAAAMLLQLSPLLSSANVASALRNTARDIGPAGRDDASGYGALDVSAAVSLIAGQGCTTSGYWMVARDGGIFAFGGARFFGSAGDIRLNQPIVGMARTPTENGYWLVASDGGIFSYGDAAFYGSTGATRLNQPIVGMAATPSGHGYWLVAADGGIFAYGDAGFYGSTGATRLNQPIVGMSSTPRGAGYWLVARDGGIFAFGDAGFYGSAGGTRLNQPIVGMSSTLSGGGYWLVAADGGIFSYGDAVFRGSAGGTTLNQAIVGMARTAGGAGYRLAGGDGRVFAYNAGYCGDLSGRPLNQPIVGTAAKG